MLNNINLTNITISQGIKIIQGGYVTEAGDVNNDGYSDFFINSYSIAYLIWGKKSSWQNINLTNLTATEGVSLYLSTSDIGTSTGVGDVNGDGYGDILISMPTGGSANQGISYLMFGKEKQDWININLNNFNSSYGISITGAAYFDGSGSFISAIGDVNNDGYCDFLIGTSNSNSYLILGRATWSDIDLSNLAASQEIKITAASDIIAASKLGDINSDGYSDFLLNTFYTGSSQTGASYLVWGKSGNWQDINLTTSAQAVKIYDSNNYDYTGWPIGYVGDLNKDGYNEIAITPTNLVTNVIWGNQTFQETDLANFNYSGNGITIKGASYFSFSGSPIYGLGDINNDGYDDLAVGASISGVANDGTIYIALGHNSSWQNIDLDKFNSSYGVKVNTESNSFSISKAGDVNGDGYDDFLIGAGYGETSDAAYLVFGGKIVSPATSPSSSSTNAPTAPTIPSFVTTGSPAAHYEASDSDDWGTALIIIGSILGVSTVGGLLWYMRNHSPKIEDDASFSLIEH